MSINEKIKTINNKIVQSKAQYNLDRQTAKISVLLSAIVSKYAFLTGKDFLLEKDLLKKAAGIKIFKYFPLGKELKKQTSFTDKQDQSFDKAFNHDEKEELVKIKKRKTINN